MANPVDIQIGINLLEKVILESNSIEDVRGKRNIMELEKMVS